MKVELDGPLAQVSERLFKTTDGGSFYHNLLGRRME